MSVIVVAIAEPIAANHAIAAIRAITRKSMAEIKEALSRAGVLEACPLFELAEVRQGLSKIQSEIG